MRATRFRVSERLLSAAAADDAHGRTDHDGDLGDGIAVFECQFFGGKADAFAREHRRDGVCFVGDSGDDIAFAVCRFDKVSDFCALSGEPRDDGDEIVFDVGRWLHFDAVVAAHVVDAVVD